MGDAEDGFYNDTFLKAHILIDWFDLCFFSLIER